MIIKDLPFADYAALPGTNWSRLSDLRTSARLYQYRDDHPRPDTASMHLGRTAHVFVLQPEVTEQYVVYRGATTGKGSRTAKKDFTADAEAMGQTVLSADEWDVCLAMRGSCLSNPDTLLHLAALTEREVSVQWTHHSGEKCKSRLDGTTPTHLVDLKTTRAVSLRLFFTDATRFGYHCQLAMYQDAWIAATGEVLPVALIVAQSVPPWDSWVVTMPESVLQTGREVYEQCLTTLQQCRAAGRWPGLADGPVDFVLPGWADPSSEDDLICDDGGSR